MVDPSQLGKLLVALGIVVIVVGVLLLLGASVPWFPRPGRLPGDFVIRRGNTTVYLPLATSILLSVLLTVVLMLWRR